jgi:hypothetical protein
MDIPCDGGDRRDDGVGPPGSKYVLKFGVVDNVRWAVALGDPLDNTSAACRD